MTQLMTTLTRLAHRTDGQDLLEYGLLAALIAVVAVAGVTAFGTTLNTAFWKDIAQTI